MIALNIAAAAVFLAALVEPRSGFAHLVSRAVPIPDVAESDYERAMALAAAAPLSERAHYLSEAETAARRDVDAGPLRPEPWVRLAIVRSARIGYLRDGAARALARSFVAAPIQAPLAASRDRFALEGWRTLGPGVRARVLAELATIYREDAPRRESLERAVTSVRDPVGRAAGEAELTLAGWRPEAPPPPRDVEIQIPRPVLPPDEPPLGATAKDQPPERL